MPNTAVISALGAAMLFGASTPFAKRLVGDVSPLMLAGVLYLGSGLGLTIARLIRDSGWRAPGIPRAERKWLVAAIFFGGVLGPALLMFGLERTSGSSASLLLNLESVLTAVLAWVVFHENFDRRILLGMLAIVAGGVVLSWDGAMTADQGWVGSVLVALACLCWAIDNNFTRKVSANDALFIAGARGAVAGTINTGLALAAGASLPALPALASAMTVGLLGYGVSLVLFVHALRGLGAARTGAYFSTAPFIGAAVAVSFFGDTTNAAFWLACALMAVGVWLHLTESHAHWHVHEPLEHSHAHVHDEHHLHQHLPGQESQAPHVHVHRHDGLAHEHPHFPDIHHGHRHR